MLFDDTYHTLSAPAQGEFRDKGSRFLAYAFPIRNEADVRPHLDALRADHPKANHHCYAYRLGLDKHTYRVNDDGEPSGTAGRPILNTLYAHSLTNVVVVVVRYFGGTLLGVPGLINAYKTATADALQNGNVVEKTVNDRYRIMFDFAQTNDVMRIVKEQRLNVVAQTFDARCALEIDVRKSLVNVVVSRLEQLPNVVVEWLP